MTDKELELLGMGVSEEMLQQMYGFESEEDLKAADHFETGVQAGYPYGVWFSGTRNPYTDAQGKELFETVGRNRYPINAKGLHIELTYASDELLEAAEKLCHTAESGEALSDEEIAKGADAIAKIVYIKHDDKDDPRGFKIKKNLLIYTPRIYPLTHSILSSSFLMRNTDKRTGYVAGDWTEYMKGDNQYSHGGVSAILCVEEHLFNAGYRTESGKPSPIFLRWRSLNGAELHKMLKQHSDYVKFLKDQVKDTVKDRRAAMMLNIQIQLWSMALVMDTTDETVRRESKAKGQGTDVFSMVNRNADPKGWSLNGFKEWFCGPELYPLLFELVHDTSVQPAKVGGLALEWCQKEYERIFSNQDEWNPVQPDGSRFFREYGKGDAPAWMRTKSLNRLLNNNPTAGEAPRQNNRREEEDAKPVDEYGEQVKIFNKIAQRYPDHPRSKELLDTIAELELIRNDPDLSQAEIDQAIDESFGRMDRMKNAIMSDARSSAKRF